MKLTGETEVLGGGKKTCPSATLTTKNTTWTAPGSNPGLRGESPATNRLSHGTARHFVLRHDGLLIANLVVTEVREISWIYVN